MRMNSSAKRSRPKGMVGRISKSRSRNMGSIRGKDTKPEVKLRKVLFAKRFRFRLHKRELPGRPDIVFPGAKVAVFCDGDFWHGKKWKIRKAAGQFRVRRNYWIPKIEGNIARDKRNTRQLRRLGWIVLRFWESDLSRDVEAAAKKVVRAVRSRRLCSVR